MASALPSFDEHLIDQVPAKARNCANENPNGVKKMQLVIGGPEKTDVAAFCLGSDWPVDASVKAAACGTPTRKAILATKDVTVNEVTFLYHPTGGRQKAVSVTVPEIESEGKRFIDVKDSERGENLIFKEAFVLNESQVMLKARGVGPWIAILITAGEGDYRLEKIGSFAYPSAPFVSIGNGAYLYDIRSSILVRKKPFGYLDRIQGLVGFEGGNAVAAYVDGRKVHVRVVQFSPDWRMEEKLVSKIEVPASCFGTKVFDYEMSVAERWRWLGEYFVWSADKSRLMLKTPCRRGFTGW